MCTTKTIGQIAKVERGREWQIEAELVKAG